MALAGKNVALVDLDFHRPMLGRFFRLGDSQPGLSSVVLGYASLDDALAPCRSKPLAQNAPTVGQQRLETTRARTTGSLVVLPTGALPPDPGEFVGTDGVGRAIAALRERVDVVLLDAPPLLAVGDGLTIAGLQTLSSPSFVRTARRGPSASWPRPSRGSPVEARLRPRRRGRRLDDRATTGTATARYTDGTAREAEDGCPVTESISSPSEGMFAGTLDRVGGARGRRRRTHTRDPRAQTPNGEASTAAAGSCGASCSAPTRRPARRLLRGRDRSSRTLRRAARLRSRDAPLPR